MQGIPKSIIVAAMVALVTPALALAGTDERAAAKGLARKSRIQQESAVRQQVALQQQAASAAKMSLVKQMQGNNDPALRTQLIRQQMQGGN